MEGPIIDCEDAVAKGERECDGLQIDATHYIDLPDPLRLVNHSCDPNCGIVNGCDLVATRDIAEGEELAYDYSTTMDEDDWTMPCACGSARCRGVVRDFVSLPHEDRLRYLRQGVVMPFIAERFAVTAAEATPIARERAAL